MKRIKLKNRFMKNPPNSVRVMRPSRFSNPFKVEDHGQQGAVDRFREYLEENPALVELGRENLAGKDLICSCDLDQPCHVDVWIEVLK